MIAWKGQAAWDAYNATQRAAWMGVVFLRGEQTQDNSLYLVTARGGENLDSDLNLVLEGTPVRIRGEWHAIVPGHQFDGLRNTVSVLTEACYQWLLFEYGGELPDSEIILRQLDGVAEQMVEDINADGVVDYTDLLNWNIYTDAQRYRGEADTLHELAMLISLDFPHEFILDASRRIVTTAPLPEQGNPGLLDYLRRKLGP